MSGMKIVCFCRYLCGKLSSLGEEVGTERISRLILGEADRRADMGDPVYDQRRYDVELSSKSRPTCSTAYPPQRRMSPISAVDETESRRHQLKNMRTGLDYEDL